MSDPTNITAVLSIDGNITFGETLLEHISAPTISISGDTEELDIIATGAMKAYIRGRNDVTVGFTLKKFANAADVTAVLAAFAAGTPTTVSITDTAMGTISGPMIVSKCDENRAAGKQISYSVELKPTYNGTTFNLSGGSSL